MNVYFFYYLRYLARFVNFVAWALQLAIDVHLGFVECILILKFLGCFEIFEIRKAFRVMRVV